MPFKFQPLEIPEVFFIETKVFNDERGFFSEIYKFSDFNNAGIKENFVQTNCSKSKKGVLRGLHYQLKPKAQGKFISVLRGRIFDVAVDLRKGSQYYGKWVGKELSEENKCCLWVPFFCAHGFFALEDNTVVLYQTSKEYDQSCERGIIWNDPDIGIKWPDMKPIVSQKDVKLPFLKEAENNFIFGEDF